VPKTKLSLFLFGVHLHSVHFTIKSIQHNVKLIITFLSVILLYVPNSKSSPKHWCLLSVLLVTQRYQLSFVYKKSLGNMKLWFTQISVWAFKLFYAVHKVAF
jgi:hypothetical protein